MDNKKPSKITVYLLAVFGASMGGLTFLGAKIALTGLDAIQVLACRWTLAMALFAVLALLRIIKVDYRKKPIRLVVLLAFIQPCVNTICETCGVDLTTTSESAIVYAMIPMTVVLISVVVLKRRVTPVLVGGIFLSFAGVIVAIAFSESFSFGGKALGYLLLLGMVVTGAMFIVLSERLSGQFTAMERTFGMAVVATIWFNGLNILRGKGFEGYVICFQEPQVGLAILFLGAIGSFTCYLVMNYVLTHMPAPQASSLQINIVTLTGVAAGILFQGDSFGWYTAVGLVLIVTGVIASNWEKKEQEGSEAEAECG